MAGDYRTSGENITARFRHFHDPSFAPGKCVMGSTITIKSEDLRIRPQESEVNRLCAANDLAKELLGWKPEHSLEEGLILTIDWIRDHLHEYRSGSYAV